MLTQRLYLVPPGRWAIGVSGGADSVALLALLRSQPHLSLHVAHLDHETRGEQSTRDAEFVAELAQRWHIPATIARREEIEPRLAHRPRNLSAMFRALRLELFRRVVVEHRLQGVILAHHRDDQVETILHRLLRGSGMVSLQGMSPSSRIGALRIVRPLLNVPRAALRDFLRAQKLTWREDASNDSDSYQRNRLRKLLTKHPRLVDPLLELGEAARELHAWVQRQAPDLPERFPSGAMQGLPLVVAQEAARSWLRRRGAPPQELSEEVIHRLLEMNDDAASPAQQDFPGGVRVRRRRGSIFVE